MYKKQNTKKSKPFHSSKWPVSIHVKPGVGRRYGRYLMNLAEMASLHYSLAMEPSKTAGREWRKWYKRSGGGINTKVGQHTTLSCLFKRLALPPSSFLCCILGVFAPPSAHTICEGSDVEQVLRAVTRTPSNIELNRMRH